ncbi:hypothetical protein AK830_g3742 [Neonectria ditissima]|uniref:Fe2OG dioxygenase domain-containing protein n=1 Tax=Neonectria ditissima TaxID=78410 RepID=A0A0P7BHG3_9HYPO|nr:hypothetical protein AK830_g3742 [Neonectria ditissima]
MAAAAVQTPLQGLPQGPVPVPYSSAEPIAPKGPVTFDPSKHLAYSPPARILTMKDLQLESTPISSIAASDPFPFLSYEAVLEHRRELFTPEVIDNCFHRTLPRSAMLRGMAQKYTPFIQSFWNSPEVLKIVSDIAGVDLVPAMNYEICHTNIQLGSEGLDGVRATPVVPPMAAKSETSQDPAGDKNNFENAIVNWHKDSHPFVIVVMLSDARNMEGGETVLMGGDGKTMSVRAPQMGSAVVLQGRHISHVALPATNMPERITIVTSFRPRDPTLADETTNANVRDESHLTELFYQWSTYRLDNLAVRANVMASALRERYAQNVKKSDRDALPGMCRSETVNYDEMKDWVEEQIKYLQQTLHEMRPLEQE